MGIMSAISMFVTMFLSPFSGRIVDKCNRKWVIVGIDVMQGVRILAIGAPAYMGVLGVPMVLAAAFLAALGSVFYSPATGTLMVDIIPRDDMVGGGGMNSLINMAGTAFSRVMVAFLGVPLIVVINGLSNLYSAVTELFVNVPETVQQGQPVSLKSIAWDSRDAVKMIFSDKCLRIFVPSALILNLLSAGPLSLMLPFCMEKNLTVDMYGYLMSVYTAVSLLCVVMLGIVKMQPKARIWVMALGISAAEVFMILAYHAKGFASMCVFAFLASFLNCAGNTVLNASLMLALPEERRGAILGFIQSVSVGGVALSAVIYGFLGDIFPPYMVFTVGKALSVLPVLYLCFHPETKAFVLKY